MTNITQALVFVVVLNALLWLSQATVIALNPESEGFYNPESSLLNDFAVEGEGDPQLDTATLTDRLPESEGTVSTSEGNIFTDMFKSIKNWFLNIPGVNYALAIVSAPYNILKTMHLPETFTFIVGTLWYAITLFLVIAFFWGKEV